MEGGAGAPARRVGYAADLDERRRTQGESANWIGGAWRPAVAGDSFAAGAGGRARAGGREGSWPRSTAEDLALARAEAGAGASVWRALDPGRRRTVLQGSLIRLAHAGEELGRDLGLGPGDGEPALCDGLERLETTLVEGASAPDAAGTFTLVRAAAAVGLDGLCRTVLETLAGGGALLLLSDPAWPAAALAVARSLDEAGLPPGVLSLLHDDGLTVLRAALGRSDLGRVRLSGPPELCERVRRAASGALQPFGAGVIDLAESPLDLCSPANSTAFVLGDEDPRAAALALVERSMGPAASFSGQRDGQVGRAVVHQRLFSELTVALLEAVDALGPPAALLDPGLAHERQERLRLGMDEGATLLRGSPGSAAGSRGVSGEGILSPCVFTNVEPGMRLAAARRPIPMLCLLRAHDDAAARALALDLDHSAPSASASDPTLRP